MTYLKNKQITKLFNNKPLLGLALLLLTGLFLVPEVTQAGFADGLLTDFVTGASRLIFFIFNFIGGILFVLGGLLVNLMLDLNLTVLDDSNTLVHVGWRIVRDIANLGFVLVIIIIAFATILRREQYGIKTLLPKLIAAAILVNFSFAIAGVFINFSNVLTNFFAERVTPDVSAGGLSGWDLSSSLSDAFGPQRLLIESSDPFPPNPEEEVGLLTEFGTAVLTSLAGLVFTVVFTLIAAFVLLAFAFMLLLRYLYLTFLVILAPLVWLFWVIPDLAGQFKKWWSKFLQWVFFAPAVMFFVYLALVSVEGLGEIRTNLEGGGFFIGSLQNIMIQGAQMIVLSGILIGGLIVAQQMGIKGASGAMGLASRAGRGTRAWAGRKALQTGTYPLRGVIGRRATEGLQKVGTGQGGGFIRKSFRNVGKFTGVNTLLRQAGSGLSEARIAGEELTTQTREAVRSRSIEENRRRFNAASNPEKVAILEELRLHVDNEKASNEVRQAAQQAIESLPADALNREIRLKFLYGEGARAGEPYGGSMRVPFFGTTLGTSRPTEDFLETRPKKGRERGRAARIEEILREAEQEGKQRAGEAGGEAGSETGKPGGGGGNP